MPTELAAGTLVDRYQLLFRLGKGGMGEVWAATTSVSELDFQKLIAIKVMLSPELQSNSAKLFFDEARTASALNHAAIVPTVDFGSTGSILYIAMDLVQGPSLSAILQRLVINKATMSPAVVGLIGMQIAAALDYAHERATFEGRPIRLVHRDISPHNVLCDLSGNPRLMDFGVARTAIQTHESRVGTVRGKPSYMAPEQVAGGNLDARSDIFALGIVLWESASLKRLFGRSNPVKSMEAVMRHEPKPLTEMVPGFPVALSNAIQRALEKDPARRFQRPGDFMEAIAAAIRTIPNSSAPERDLAALIQSNFPTDAFDIERRVEEAKALLALNTAEPTRYTQITKTAGVGAPEASAPALLPTVAWPSAPGPDPLAPEAIEEARTAFASRTPSGLRVLNMAGSPTSEAHNLFTGQSAPILRSRTNRWLAPTVAVAACFIGAAAVVATRGRSTAALPEVARPSTEDSSAVRVLAKPTAKGEPLAEREAPLIQPPGEDTAALARDPEEARARRTAAPKRTPIAATESTPATKPAPPPPARDESAGEPDATPAEVLELIRKVKAIDPAAASQMYPALAEAGSHNVEALNELRRKSRAVLSRGR